MRSLLALLLTVPALGSSLRGGERRSLMGLDPIPMEGDQIAFIVTYDFQTPELTDRGATEDEYEECVESVHDWMTTQVVDPVLRPDPEYAIQRGFGDNGCESNLIHSEYTAETGAHSILVQYICKFRQVDSPSPVEFTTKLKNQADKVGTELQAAIELENPPSDYIWSSVTGVSTTTSALSWQPVGSANRDNFDNAFVMSYILTWSLTTPPVLPLQVDFDVTANATKEWVTNYWDAVYPQIPGHQFARRTVDVKPRYSSMSPTASLYQQTISYGVEILIGANNITDLPSVAEYTTTMQLFYRVTNFTNLLDEALPPDSIFRDSKRTAFAITPTFDVQLLEDHKNKTTSVIVVDDLTASSSFAVALGL